MIRILFGILLALLSFGPVRAQQSKTVLLNQIAAQLPPGCNGCITPQVLQTVLNSIVLSYMDLGGASTASCGGTQAVIGWVTLSTPQCGLPQLAAGTSGQIQYNNGGNLGGFTVIGDCSLVVPNILCSKTNGVAFAASATTDTTNAGNITKGNLSVNRLNGGTLASSSTFWRGDGQWVAPPAANTSTVHLFYANLLSTYGLGLTNFVCDGVTDNTPAWNAFMAATWSGAIPAFSILSFDAIDRTLGYCAFNSRPAQWGNSLYIEGAGAWFLRNYQPGSLSYVSGTTNLGGLIELTVGSTAGIGTFAAVNAQPTRAVFTGSMSGSSTLSVSSITSGSITKGTTIVDGSGNVIGIVSACPAGNCSTTGSYTMNSAATFTSRTMFAKPYFIGVSGVLGTAEANGLWVPSVLDGTHVELLFDIFGNTSAFSHAFTGSFTVSNAIASGSGLTLTVSAGASSIVNSPGFGVSIGGITGLTSGAYPVDVLSNTSVKLVGTGFGGTYTSGGNFYPGTIYTQPLEPFIELGPQSDSDHNQSEVRSNHLLIYAGCNWGGIGLDLGSHSIGSTGLGDTNYSIIENTSVAGAVCGATSTGTGHFGVYFRVDGSNSPGIPEGSFSGNRANTMKEYFSGAGLWAGIWLQSATAFRGYNLLDNGVGSPSLANQPTSLVANGIDSLLASYDIGIYGSVLAYPVYFGPNANTSVVSLDNTTQFLTTDSTDTALWLQAAFCTFAPSLAAGVNVTANCNGSLYTTSTYQIVPGGTGGVQLTPGATSWAAISDEREKTNIHPITVLDRLTGDDIAFGYDRQGTPELGVVAQRLQKMFPEFVTSIDYEGKPRLGVFKDEVGIAALQGVKELKDRLDKLEQKLSPVQGSD